MEKQIKNIAFRIANNDKFFGLGINIEDLELIIQESKLMFNKNNIKTLFNKLESKRITDNSDYISIPIKDWEEIKNEFIS